jgi:hypothetical protein
MEAKFEWPTSFLAPTKPEALASILSQRYAVFPTTKVLPFAFC